MYHSQVTARGQPLITVRQQPAYYRGRRCAGSQLNCNSCPAAPARFSLFFFAMAASSSAAGAAATAASWSADQDAFLAAMFSEMEAKDRGFLSCSNRHSYR